MVFRRKDSESQAVENFERCQSRTLRKDFIYKKHDCPMVDPEGIDADDLSDPVTSERKERRVAFIRNLGCLGCNKWSEPYVRRTITETSISDTGATTTVITTIWVRESDVLNDMLLKSTDTTVQYKVD